MERQAPCFDGAQPSGRVTVGDIARAHGAALRAEHTLTPEQHQVTVMFGAASKTVLTLSRDKKRLGGTPALTMVLHTWTRDLRFHPHIHAIVSAGAMNEQGQWVHSRKDYLFPVKVMARLFRRFVREAVLAAIDKDELVVPEDSVATMRRALFETAWLVYAKAPFGGAEQVFSYLGRYTHRVGISNARIQYADAHRVTFATKNGRTCTLRPVEFLRRFLLHVLPRGFHKIRHYGLCSTHHVAHGTLIELRDKLAATSGGPAPRVMASENADTACQPSDSASPPQTWVECLLALTGVDALRCPQCANGRLVARPLDQPVHQARLDTS